MEKLQTTMYVSRNSGSVRAAAVSQESFPIPEAVKRVMIFSQLF